MIKKKYKFIIISFISVIIISIIFYKISFYTPPLLDSGKRNIADKPIDFLSFGWHFTKASIYKDYLKNIDKSHMEQVKAGLYRKKYLAKRFKVKGEDLDLVLDVYKNLNINSLIEKLYVFLLSGKNYQIRFFREAGEEFFKYENWRVAVEAFSKVVDSNPNDYMSHYYLGLSYLHLKKFSVANEYFEKVIELKPDFADAYYRLGIIAEKEKNWGKAQRLYEKAINIQANHFDSLTALKRINEKLK